MAWRRPGDKPLSEPMMVRLLTHICITRPQWVKDYKRYIHILNCILGLTWPSRWNHPGTTIHVVCPIQPIACLLMLWRLQEPGHQQEWYWTSKSNHSVSSIRGVNLSVQTTEYALQLMPTSQLLMPCFLDSPDHQQPWYKLCNTQLLVFIWGEFYWNTHTASMWRNDIDGLTHWGRDKMYAISQTTFWSAFSWMKMYKLPLRFHWSLFLCVQLTIFQHWFRSWLGTDQATSHYLNQWWLIYWCIYASLGLNELIQKKHNSSALAMEFSLLHKGISRISKCMHIFVVAFFFF